MAEDAITLDVLKRSVEAIGGKVRVAVSDSAYVVVEDPSGDLVFNASAATQDEAAQRIADGLAGRRVVLARHLAWIGQVEKAAELLAADPSRSVELVQPVPVHPDEHRGGLMEPEERP